MADPTVALCMAGVVALVMCYAVLVLVALRSVLRYVRTRVVVVNTSELCYTCCEAMSEVALLYCGHGGLCHACARKVLAADRRCPLCRAAVCGVMLPTTDVVEAPPPPEQAPA